MARNEFGIIINSLMHILYMFLKITIKISFKCIKAFFCFNVHYFYQRQRPEVTLVLTIACPVIGIKPVSNLTCTVKAAVSIVTDTISVITVMNISGTLVVIRAVMKILIKDMSNITRADIGSVSIGTYLFTSSIVSQTLVDIYKKMQELSTAWTIIYSVKL